MYTLLSLPFPDHTGGLRNSDHHRAGWPGLWDRAVALATVLDDKRNGAYLLVIFPESYTVCPSRASCWQPGARTPMPPGVSEDCLYLNVFVPENMVSTQALAVFSLETFC
jgi:hypothetical protein